MRLAAFFFVVILVIAAASSVSAESGAFWIYGTITSLPQQVQTFNNVTYLQFDFLVDASNSTSIDWLLPESVTVLIPPALLLYTVEHWDLTLNLTCTSNVEGTPEGCFVAEAVNTGAQGSGQIPDWVQTLKTLFDMAGQVGGVLVTLVVQVVAGILPGVPIPTYAVALGLLACIIFLFMWTWRKLPWFMALIELLVLIALVSNLINSLGF